MRLSLIREEHRKFYEEHGHYNLGSSSLVPVEDTGPLFTTAGMHPLVPYLKGEKPSENGNRLSSCQKVVRTSDIDEVGDNTHLTFFEMIGNWSIGDYGKKETLEMSLAFLKRIEGLPMENLWVTVFEGNDESPRDLEAFDIWLSLGVPEERIVFLGKEDNWWAMGDVGLCGPCSEMFIDTNPNAPVIPGACLGDDEKDRFVEIGNNVFMDFFRQEDGSLEKLEKSNIDVGLGLERLAVISEGLNSVFDLPDFQTALSVIETHCAEARDFNDGHSWRVIAEHCRALMAIIGDSNPTYPSNTGRGYIVRMLVRRAHTEATKLGLPSMLMSSIIEIFLEEYRDAYPELEQNISLIQKIVEKEIASFEKTLSRGEKEISKVFRKKDSKELNGEDLFDLKQTHGIPVDLAHSIAEKLGGIVSMDGYDELFKQHQEASKA